MDQTAGLCMVNVKQVVADGQFKGSSGIDGWLEDMQEGLRRAACSQPLEDAAQTSDSKDDV